MNREAWLQKAISLIRPWFAPLGLNLPDTIHVSVGFPSKGALSRKTQRLGECWKPSVSADGSPQIYINPMIADGPRVLDILVHELIHAALPEAKHGRKFAAAATLLGLEGKPTATIASEALRTRLSELIERELGIYPHPALSPNLQDKKQTTRLIKVECANAQCEVDEKGHHYTARITRVWLAKSAPLCPLCESIMIADSNQLEALEG